MMTQNGIVYEGGYYGVGKMNESGEWLLFFCAMNELTIMNIYSSRRRSFTSLRAWQHPGSNSGTSCIDYILMRKQQRHLCCNAQVLRSAILAGVNGILSEMGKSGGVECFDYMLELF